MTITNMMTDANTLPGHIRQNCPELKRRGQRKNDDPKSLRAWSGEDALKYDQNETINICFMEMGEPSEMDCRKLLTNIKKLLKKRKTGKSFSKQVRLKLISYRKNLMKSRCN
ncbi:hypothetical protein KY290_000963 [Solanum tuberosum]|uniref:Uncharacterized protein n=1 Tax=Solanum tuberosum TaxID=4113 RepID=A0ABQ7WN14_SOLTU|nr:hypothetical protein KY290_000963 [Solanum tuberosum]